MLDVVFLVQSRDIRATKGFTAGLAQEVEPAEIVALAERVLLAIGAVGWEKLGSYTSAAVLRWEDKRMGLKV